MRPHRLNRALDLGLDALNAALLTGPRIDRLAARQPPRSVIVLSVYSESRFLAELVRAGASSRHQVRFALGALTPDPAPDLAAETRLTGLEGSGKRENLNALLSAIEAWQPFDADWIVTVDDDIDTGPARRRFLDRFLALLEHFAVDFGQPALTRMSETAWRIVRRRPFALLRETCFVEPQLVAFRRHVARELMPFPEDFGGWGLDLHWGARALERGWHVGVVDALPVRHELRPYGTQYSVGEATKLRELSLAQKPHVQPDEAERTFAVHRTLLRRRAATGQADQRS